MVSRISSTLFKITRLSPVLILIFPCIALATSITVNSNMGFGLIEFAPSHQGELALGSNGGVSLTGTGLFYQGGAVAGQITIVGDDGVVEFRCSDKSILGGNKGGTLEVTDIEASVGTGVSSGSGTACKGASSSSPDPIILDLGAAPDPRIYFGGKLDIPFGGITSSQEYETSNGSGAPLSVNAVFQ